MARAQAVLWFDLTTSPVKRLSCPRALRGSFVRKFAQILSQPVSCWHRGPFSSPTGTPVLCQKLWNNFPLPLQTSHVFPPQNSDSQHWNKPDSFWVLEGIKQKATQRHWLPWYFMVLCGLLKGFSQKWKFFHYLFTLMSFQTCRTVCLLWNRHNKSQWGCFGPHWLPLYRQKHTWKYHLVYSTEEKVMKGWNDPFKIQDFHLVVDDKMLKSHILMEGLNSFWSGPVINTPATAITHNTLE